MREVRLRLTQQLADREDVLPLTFINVGSDRCQRAQVLRGLRRYGNVSLGPAARASSAVWPLRYVS